MEDIKLTAKELSCLKEGGNAEAIAWYFGEVLGSASSRIHPGAWVGFPRPIEASDRIAWACRYITDAYARSIQGSRDSLPLLDLGKFLSTIHVPAVSSYLNRNNTPAWLYLDALDYGVFTDAFDQTAARVFDYLHPVPRIQAYQGSWTPSRAQFTKAATILSRGLSTWGAGWRFNNSLSVSLPWPKPTKREAHALWRYIRIAAAKALSSYLPLRGVKMDVSPKHAPDTVLISFWLGSTAFVENGVGMVGTAVSSSTPSSVTGEYALQAVGKDAAGNTVPLLWLHELVDIGHKWPPENYKAVTLPPTAFLCQIPEFVAMLQTIASRRKFNVTPESFGQTLPASTK